MPRIKKFNSGYSAILCSKCRTILKQGSEITKEDWASNDPLYCVNCKEIIELKKQKK